MQRQNHLQFYMMERMLPVIVFWFVTVMAVPAAAAAAVVEV
jgi:hypothetical protein